MESDHLVLTSVRREFNGVVAVEDLSLTIKSGEIFVLLGPSGCGKSTTLQLINRLLELDHGSIALEGRDISEIDPVKLRRSIGYVIQQIGLFPHLTVAENTATVCTLLGWGRERTRNRVNEMLNLVDLDPGIYANRYPSELSGGQQQRVGVARALASGPATLLMDEPFGALDPIVHRQLQFEFRQWVQKLGTTVLFVTHDVSEAILLGDRVAILGERCHVEQIGTPLEVLGRPANANVENFLGEDRVLRVLSVIPVTQALGGTSQHGPDIDSSASAHDALTLMLSEGADSITVSNTKGAPLGTVTWHTLIKAALTAQGEKA